MPQAPDSYYRKPPEAKHRTGAGGVVARLTPDNKILIALIRERGNPDYVLPKGGVELGESLEQAAAREIQEEAGFKNLKLLTALGVGERLGGRKKNTWQKTHYYLFLTPDLEGKPTDHRDWEVHWHDLDHLPTIYWPEQERLIKDNREKIIALVRNPV
jgi:bis(5'-nucleosidyl)-tetraphosphatase